VVTGVTLGWFFWCSFCHSILALHMGMWRVACWQTWFCQPICGLVLLPLSAPHTLWFAIQGRFARASDRPTKLCRHVGQRAVWVYRTHTATHTRRCSAEDYASASFHFLRPVFLGIFLAGFFIPRISNLLASVYVLHVLGWEFFVILCLLQSL